MSERREGHSKLVYDKATRTIVTVDPNPTVHPPVPGLVERLIAHVQQALRDYGIPDDTIANDPEIASSTREAFADLTAPFAGELETDEVWRQTLKAWAEGADNGLTDQSNKSAILPVLRDFDRLRTALAASDRESAGQMLRADEAIRERNVAQAALAASEGRAGELETALTEAERVLTNYADPSGYIDEDGNIPELNAGALARATLPAIRAVLTPPKDKT